MVAGENTKPILREVREGCLVHCYLACGHLIRVYEILKPLQKRTHSRWNAGLARLNRFRYGEQRTRTDLYANRGLAHLLLYRM
jgi:hypothetical protein